MPHDTCAWGGGSKDTLQELVSSRQTDGECKIESIRVLGLIEIRSRHPRRHALPPSAVPRNANSIASLQSPVTPACLPHSAHATACWYAHACASATLPAGAIVIAVASHGLANRALEGGLACSPHVPRHPVIATLPQVHCIYLKARDT